MKILPKNAMILTGILTAAFLLAACLPTATPVPPTSAPAATPRTSADSGGVPTRLASQSGARGAKKYNAPPAMGIDPSASYKASIKTNNGTIDIELFPANAPKTVNNFVFLAREGFYDGIIFHRVIPNFMIQGGDPTGTGTSGPGYKFEDEFDQSLGFDGPGVLAMANSGPNTNGSQFFITVAPTPHLKGAHTIFGRVTNGQSVADDISKVAAGPGNKPTDPVVIETIGITESPGS